MPPTSIQLPNLPALCKDFAVRTNPRCRAVSARATAWARAHGLTASESEAEVDPGHDGTQLGLLAALCFPTCDASQLLAATQLLTLLVHWAEACPGGAGLAGGREGAGAGAGAEGGDIPTCAACEPAFAPLRARLLPASSPSSSNPNPNSNPNSDPNAASTPEHEPWRPRLERHLRLFHAARAWLRADAAGGVVPDLESYLTLRRASCGAPVLCALAQFAEGLCVPRGLREDATLRALEQNCVDAVAWSLDLVSYAQKQAAGDTHNLVAVLMAQRALAPQAAVYAAGKLVQGVLESFVANERAFLASLDVPSSRSPSSSPSPAPSPSGSRAPSRSPSPTGSEGRTDGERERKESEDARRYVRALRDVVVGCVYWYYESERFFGAGGEDVRMFGWVFLPPKV